MAFATAAATCSCEPLSRFRTGAGTAPSTTATDSSCTAAGCGAEEQFADGNGHTGHAPPVAGPTGFGEGAADGEAEEEGEGMGDGDGEGDGDRLFCGEELLGSGAGLLMVWGLPAAGDGAGLGVGSGPASPAHARDEMPPAAPPGGHAAVRDSM